MSRTEVTPAQTGQMDRNAWYQTRYSALVDALIARGVDHATAIRTGLMLLPLEARETGNGGSEYNYNVGNLRPSSAGEVPSGTPGWHGMFITRTHGQYRAYETLLDGTADFVRLLTTSRYNPAYQYLLSSGDVAGFYERLIRAGYYPADEAEIQTARREYQSLYNSLLARNLVYVPSPGTGSATVAASSLAPVVAVAAAGAGLALIAKSLRKPRRR